MRAILGIIWIIDILNIGSNIYGFNLVSFLDETIPINFIGWLLFFIFIGFSEGNTNINYK